MATNSVSIVLHSLKLPGPGGESRKGGCVPSPWAECTQEIHSINSLCVELEKMPGLITFWSKFLGDDDEWIGLFLSLWCGGINF